MLTNLSLDLPITSILRTHQQQDVQASTRAVLERVECNRAFAPLMSSYIYATTHHYQPRSDPFDWKATPQVLLADLAGEPRASILLEGPHLGAKVHLHFNCKNEIVKEKIAGKRRNVPKKGDTSQASLGADAAGFADPAFTQAYLNLLGDIFEIIGGEYGHAHHLSIRHGSDFDRIHQSFFEPWFITWANLFGPALVARLGRERLLGAPAHEVRELPGGSIMLTVAASPVEQLESGVQERIARVKAHLGILSPSERATPEELASSEARRAAAQAEMKQRIEQAFRQAREHTATEMRRQAQGCVQGVQQFWREQLDFSPQSLVVIDRLIRTGFKQEEDADTIATAVQAFGAYTGEVVQRTLGGVWHDEEMNGQPVLLNVGPRKIRVEPFCVVHNAFEQRPAGKQDLLTWYGEISKRA